MANAGWAGKGDVMGCHGVKMKVAEQSCSSLKVAEVAEVANEHKWLETQAICCKFNVADLKLQRIPPF